MERDNIVFQTLDLMEATLMKSVLEASGIEVYLVDENISRLKPIYSWAIGGIKLIVPDNQINRAREVIREYRSKQSDDRG
jgi:hypothetical protein